MDEQSELIKEVFARFGTAYYESEVLHRGLCNIYALATFETPESVTRPRIDEKLTYAYSLTLGQVIKESRYSFPADIQYQLDLALSKRNFLAHHFWFEKNHMMLDRQGLITTSKRINRIHRFF